MPSVVSWLVDEHEEFQANEKLEHIDDCENSGMCYKQVDDDSGELGEIEADVKAVALDVCTSAADFVAAKRLSEDRKANLRYRESIL